MTLVSRARGEVAWLLRRGSVGRNAANIYSLQVFRLAIGLIGSIILARVLGPEQKGILDLFGVLGTLIAEIGLLGFGGGLIYYLTKRQQPLPAVHASALAYAVLGGTALAFLGWLFLDFWRVLFPILEDWVILLAFAAAPLTLYGSLATNIFTGLNRATTVFVVGLCYASLTTAIIVLLFLGDGLNVRNVLYLIVASFALNSVTLFVVLRRAGPGMAIDLELHGKAFRYGLLIFFGAIANIVHFKIDQVMLGYFLGSEAVGLYAVGVRWAELLFLLDTALIFSALTRMSSAPRDEGHRFASRVLKTQGMISVAAAIALAVVGVPLIKLLYGPQFYASAMPMLLLIPGVVCWSLGKVMVTNLTYNLKLGGYCSAAALAGLVANVILNYLFIKEWALGIQGAAIASSISYGLVAALIAVRFWRERPGRSGAGEPPGGEIGAK